jgi:cytochrome c oxidase subunit 3
VSGSALEARKRAVDGAVGLTVFLGALAMVFAALLLAFAVLRAQAPAWPPPGAGSFPREAAALNGVLLVLASLAIRGGAVRPAFVAGAFALGLGFLAGQALLWRHLVAARLGPGAGTLGDAFFALSGFHALHVLGGLVALAASVGRPERLRLTRIYWDFVLVIWAVVLIALCLP